MALTTLRSQLAQQADPHKADHVARFFKTGPGEYAAGEQFMGITVPVLRTISKQFQALKLTDLQKLLNSRWHEERMMALLILIQQYRRGKTVRERKQCYDFYVANKTQVNNWDLVDVSAPHIVGDYLFDKKASVLTTWAKQSHLWSRRIAIVSTWHFVRRDRFEDTLQLATLLLDDTHDLMHKATGWMLREVGKRDVRVLENFLQQHYQYMPRTMLRYAIERLSKTRRLDYLQDRV